MATNLSAYTTSAQSTIKIFSGLFKSASTFDLITLGSPMAATSAGQVGMVQALFAYYGALPGSVLVGAPSFTGYAASATSAEFAATLVDTITAGTTISTTTKDGWKAAVVAALPSFASRAEAAIALLNLVDTYTGTDADVMAANNAIDNRAEYTAGWARTTAGATYSSVTSLVNTVGSITDSVTSIPPVTTGQTFTLTTGIDTGAGFIGGVGDDTFNATGSATANAFNSLDSIDGGAGANTLNIVSPVATSLGAGAVTVKNIQTANLTDAAAVTLDTTGWTGLTNLTIGASTGGGAVTVASGTAVTQTNTLATHATAPTATTIDGGSAVTLTATGSASGTTVLTGDILIGGTTAPGGAVTVTATETVGVTSSSAGNITVKGGTDVSVTSTVNAGFAVGAAAALTGSAATTPVTAGNAAVIVVNGATGNVNVSSATNNTSTTAVTVTAEPIYVTGGKAVTVAQTLSTTQSTSATISTINQGAVSVTGGSGTTSVKVTQAAVDATGAVAAAATAAITGVAAVGATAAAPGVQPVSAVTAVNGGNSAAAVAAVTGTPIVALGAVTIADATNTSTATSTITSVTLANYANSTFAGSALTTLSLSGDSGTLGITNGAGAAATNTTLALTVNGLSNTTAANTITDVNNVVKTLNVTTGADASTLTAFTDTALKTLNIDGSSVLTLGTVPTTLTALTVTGAAGFSGDISGVAGITAFAPTSSGKITATMDPTAQTFTGSSGQDVITINLDATKAITGGSATTNQLILTNTAATYTAANTGKNVTGFTTLVSKGAAGNVDTWDMNAVFKGYTTVEQSTAYTGAQSYTGVASGTKLLIDAANTSVSYSLQGTAGIGGTAPITLAKSTSTAGITVGTLTLTDSNADGITNATVASLTKTSTAGITNTITTLADTALSNLTITGGAALAIGTLSLGTPGQAVPTGVSTFTLTNNTTAFNNTGSAKVASVITTMTDDTLGTLSFAGTNPTTVTTLNANNSVFLTISNTSSDTVNITTLSTNGNAAKTITNGLSDITFSGSAAVKIATLSYANANGATTVNLTNSGTATDTITAWAPGATLTTLNVSGKIALGSSGTTTPISIPATTGITVAAGTDDAHVNISLGAAAVSKTNTVTLGNGNNNVIDATIAGTSTITVGTGYNLIDVKAGGNNATFASTITLGTHTNTTTAFDQIKVSVTGSQAVGYSTTITGAVTGDQIVFVDGAQSVLVTPTAAQQTTLSASGSLATAITTAFGMLGTAHQAMAFTYGSDTYVIENVGADTAFTAGTDSVVKLAGVHTISAVTSGTATIALAS